MDLVENDCYVEVLDSYFGQEQELQIFVGSSTKMKWAVWFKQCNFTVFANGATVNGTTCKFKFELIWNYEIFKLIFVLESLEY